MVGVSDLLHKGFDLASNFLSYLREGDERTHEVRLAAVNSATETSPKLISAIDDVARKLDDAVQNIVGQLSEKLEHDQLEKLASQVKAVHFALEFGDKGMLGPALGRIMEQIEYAKNRLSEGKQEWLGPWLMAESIRIVALREIASTEKAVEMIKREAHTFRLNILDFGGPILIESKKVPWTKIADFVEGRNEEVIKLISAASVSKIEAARHDSSADEEEQEQPTAKPNNSSVTVKAALNPAAAWPFPSGSRP